MKPPIVRAHEAGAHRDRRHGLCPSCRAGEPVDLSWVARAKAKQLPTRIDGGVPTR